MKDERKTEIKVGIVSVAGLLIFLWILLWAKDFSFKSTEKDLIVQFPEVSGLEIGDYVTVNGVRQGNVTDIAIEKQRVLVSLRINNEVDIRKDAVFAITMLDLMGGKKIEIKPGTSPQKIDYGQIQQGVFYADIPTVMSLLGLVQEDLTASIKDLRITLNSLNEYLTDQELRKQVKTSVEDLSAVLKKLNSVIDQNENSIRELTKNTAELSKNANTFIVENKDNLSSSIIEVRSVMLKADTLMSELNSIARDTKSGNNNLGRLLYDKELFNKIEKTLSELNELTRIITEQLKSDGLKVDADVDLF